MRILLFDYHNFLNQKNIVFTNDSDFFYTEVLNKNYNILIVNFNFYEEVREIHRFFKGYLIFVGDYIDEVIYKKSLEIGDFYYSYEEYYKLNLRLNYLKKKVLKLKSSIFKFKDLLFNFDTEELYQNSHPVNITNAQIELLKVLIINRDKYLTSVDIVESCETISSIESVKVLIFNLRKLGFTISNKKNLGYKLEEK